MDNSFAIGLSAQQVLHQRMDTTANNLANMTTTGFKAEHLVMRELSERPAAAADLPNGISFVNAWKLQRDMSGGPIEHTGNPLDAAIQGEGFFSVQTPDGTAYTRDGRFGLDSSGQLVTHDGMPVLGSGGPITLDPDAGPVTIGKDGAIVQDGQVVGTLNIVAFDAPAGLEKMGGNLWKANGQPTRAPEGMTVAGGALEGSNVNPVVELTHMIDISRTYEAVGQMLNQADQLRGSSIDKLSRTS
ncbi:MAG: flagellar basal-body rod protein FlgF [Alphaproteobacteria bacterium]|nr:flagellar basal-body rod protein FlgF [Alphaproteobacteria bacterium]